MQSASRITSEVAPRSRPAKLKSRRQIVTPKQIVPPYELLIIEHFRALKPDFKMFEDSDPISYLMMVVAHPPPDSCVPWPFAIEPNSGYGAIKYKGKKYTANRLSLIFFGGGYDMPGLDAAHGPCHYRACFNPHPDHGLRWATRSENAADRWRDGTMLKTRMIDSAGQ